MQEFIRNANIAAFRKQLLEKPKDAYQRLVLLKLLAEEEAKAPPAKATAREDND